MTNRNFEKVQQKLIEKQSNVRDSDYGAGFDVFNEVNTRNGIELVYNNANGP